MKGTLLNLKVICRQQAPAWSLLALCALSLFTANASADSTITLTLPPSRAARRLAAQQKRQQQEQQKEKNASRRPPPSRGSVIRQDIVGSLGRILTSTVIHKAPYWNSRTMCHVEGGTYVAVREEKNGWDGILMEDGRLGWMPQEAVQNMNSDAVLNSDAVSSLADDPERRHTFPHGDAPLFQGDTQKLMNVAYSFLGVPYEWGGNTHKGIDCSGFVKRVFAAMGYNLPRTANEQAAVGVPVPVDQLQCGDRLYFELSSDGSRIKHTGIYLGNGYFIHSSVTHHGVAISILTHPEWRHIFVCARR